MQSNNYQIKGVIIIEKDIKYLFIIKIKKMLKYLLF